MKPYYCLLILLLLFGSASQAQLQNQVSLEPEVETTEKVEARKNVVKLYTRKEKGVLLVTSHRSYDVQIYIFDLEGTMMYQGPLKKREKIRIESLYKGTYTYTIFHKEQSIEEGKLIIK